ncbi:hypothetical protein [Phormidium sp. CCY1219]|uniref:hypothetical protein n=1 Tax=Phormidium sp. CCY1219 TaxID=2886104 RepID=UPI002D7763DA|nr:hypothetical protein [Phormidium sp. CCY1219]
MQLGNESNTIEDRVIFLGCNMVGEKDYLDVQEHIQEVEKFLSTCKDIRKWKRAEAVRLRCSGFSYKKNKERVRVFQSFIVQQKNDEKRSISGLKLACNR